MVLLVSTTHAWNFFSSDTPKPRARAPEKIEPFSGPTPECLSKYEQYNQNRYTCPKPTELKKVGLRWESGKTWKSFQNSFTDTISRFLGAQWKGVGVGNVICVYESDNPSDFPIELVGQKLVQRPDYPKWENNPRSSLINCLTSTNNTCDCQFSYYEEEEPEDIDTIIENLKKTR